MSALLSVTQSTFGAAVLSSDRPVLVDFWAPWSGPSRMLMPIVEKVQGRFQSRVTFFKINTDENPSIAGEYQISGIPVLVLFKGGRAVDRIVGFVPERTIEQMLDKHLAAV